ncbi:calcium homeostasis modulator protein 6-like [Cololabis saira]|uniref:calcium homeostasis modulator protein 6-like n=1 Tax=Cololabis saira TaxID=129043 RepID=UPI002AD34BB4|nr:calcium homeostasis modulator protein 6-like [Cololabis saira]XP_061574147.1 calcium homeostasis modulator protein 6-like [Cololabis saira]
MDKFKTVLNIASKQKNYGFGLVALLTAGGEQIFSTVAFRCPCNELNFLYGMVFLLVPALALLLLGYILSTKTWKLVTGVCQHRAKPWHRKNLLSSIKAFFQISAAAMVAPSSWIAVALLSGSYYECAMTGTNVSVYNQHLCEDANSNTQCEKVLHRLPCGGDSQVRLEVQKEILNTLRAQSQILGWLLIASIMLSNLLLICLARCTSPISYLQLKFWSAYTQEESDLIKEYSTKHAKELAERNLKSFFNLTAPADFKTPSNTDWEKISALYKFSTKDEYYSTLHRCVENCSETDVGIKMVSVRSNSSAYSPAALDFVDGGPMSP